jgi:hypothetical protein
MKEHLQGQFCRNERTLIGAILPKGCSHINGIKSYTFENNKLLLIFSSYCFSIVYDFIVKSIGKPNLHDTPNILPVIENSIYNPCLINRTLRLNCLTTHYAELWQELYTPEINKDSFTKSDPRLKLWNNLTQEWSRYCALRTPYERRQALVEIDALSALSLGLTIEELLTIYRIQFPVLQKYEKENHYDQNGLLIPNEVLKIAQKEGIDITKPGSSIKYTDPRLYPLMEREYVTPFDTCDREADMRQAYEYFKSVVVSSQ